MDRLPFGGRSTQKSSGPAKALQGLTSAFGGAKGKSSGGSRGKSAGGLAALAGIAGLAIKNRSKITDRLGGGRQQDEPEVTPVDSVPPTTPPPTTPAV
jgi:hypothetical protein